MKLKRRQKSISADRWNELHPIGTAVEYWPGTRDGIPRIGQTRSSAWEVSGSAVVLVADDCGRPVPGGVALTHVEPRPELSPC